jgi:hypothetical protein
MPRFPVGKRAQPYHRPSDQKSFAFLSKGVQAACALVTFSLVEVVPLNLPGFEGSPDLGSPNPPVRSQRSLR